VAGLFGLSVDQNHEKDFLETLFLGTFYLQHLGEEYCGLATSDEIQIRIRTHRGLFWPSFSQDMGGLEGIAGIGYCGHAREPLLIDSRLGRLAFCFSGNIQNLSELVGKLKRKGHFLERGDDVEVIAHLVCQGENLVNGIEKMNQRVKGAFVLLILTTQGEIYAVRSPDGHWPLVFGERDGMVAVASESNGFDNLKMNYFFDLKPGEIALLKNGEVRIEKSLPKKREQICSFLWVYTAFPNAVFEGIPASIVRKRLGAALAQADCQSGFWADVVTPIPESGRYHAIGYYQWLCNIHTKDKPLPIYDELLLKYPFAGRSFTPLDPRERTKKAQIKILKSSERYTGLKVVVCDDSLVRGVQTRSEIVPKLKAIGFKEIHFRMSYPEIVSHCPWGKTTKEGEVIANQIPSIEERVRFLQINSLRYNQITDLVEAIGLPSTKLCLDCLFPRREHHS